MATTLIIFRVLVAFCTLKFCYSNTRLRFYRRPITSPTTDCDEPLGMYNGAIEESDVSCSRQHIAASLPSCGNCQRARYRVDLNPSIYWCIDLSTVQSAWYRISFKFVSYLSNVTVASLDGQHADYFQMLKSLDSDSSNDESYYYVFNRNVIKQYNVGSGVRSIAIQTNVLHFKMEFFSTNPIVAMKFEFFGCPYYAYARPLGMQNMEISESQLMSHPDINADNSEIQNPWGSRLNSVGVGWRSLGSTINTAASPDNIFLRINMKDNFKIVYIEYQMKLASTPTYQTAFHSFFIKYGITEDRMQWYQNPDATSADKREIKVMQHNVEGITYRTAFKYPLHARFFQFHPLACITADCRNIKLELFGGKEELADHDWSGGISGDHNMISSISGSGKFKGGTYQHYMAHDKLYGENVLRSSFYQSNDCLLDPDQCTNGLSVAFWSRHPEHLHARRKASFSYVNISQVNAAGGCSITDDPTYEFTYMRPFLIIATNSAPINAYAKVTSAAIVLLGTSFVGESFLRASLYMNPNVDHVNSCGVTAVRGLKPVFSTDTAAVKSHYSVHSIKSFGLQRLVDSPVWKPGTTVGILIEPVALTLDVGEFIYKDGSIKVTYLARAMQFQKTDIVQSLPASSFISSETCADDDIYNIRFTSTGWRMCGINNFAVVDLGQAYTISMVKLAGYDDQELNVLTSVKLTFSMDGDKFGSERRIKKIFPNNHRTEYIALSPTVFGRWVKIESSDFRGNMPALRFDVVAVGDAPDIDKRERKWIKLQEDSITMHPMHDKPGFVDMTRHLDISHFKVVYKEGPGIGLTANWPTTNKLVSISNQIRLVISATRASTISDTTIYAPLSMDTPASYDDELVMRTKVPVYFKPNDVIYMWNFEDFHDVGDDNNEGFLTVDLYGFAKSTPGSFIREKCLSYPCRCLGVSGDDGTSLVLDQTCKDMFYFDHAEHMVHLNSGRCVQITSNSVLETSTDGTCAERFSSNQAGHLFRTAQYPTPTECVDLAGGLVKMVGGCALSFEFLPFVETEYEYKEFKQRFFKVQSAPLDSFVIEDTCDSHGMTMPILKTNNELMMWKRLMSESSPVTSHHFLGLYNLHSTGVYTWLDGSPHDLLTAQGNTYRCKAVSNNGVISKRHCYDNTEVICQVKELTDTIRHHTVMTSGLSELGTMTHGKGFRIGMTNQDLSHVTFTMQTSLRYGKLFANTTGYRSWHHFTFVYDKDEHRMWLYVDGALSATTQLLEFFGERTDGKDFSSDYTSFFGDYELPLTSIQNHAMASIQMWRYPLSAHAIRPLAKSVTYTFAEISQRELGGYEYEFGSVCSDTADQTGSCSDITDINIDQHLENLKPDSDLQCVWRDGKGETIVNDLGKTSTIEQCISSCHTLLQNHQGVNGATYGVEPLNLQGYQSCSCIQSDGSLDTTASNGDDFKTCFFPMPVKYGNIMDSMIDTVAFTPDRVWLYASNTLQGKIYNVKFTDPPQLSFIIGGGGTAFEFDTSSTMWILNQDKFIVDKVGNDYTANLTCQSFAVDSEHLFCVKDATGELHKKIKTVDGVWAYMGVGASSVIVSPNQALYTYSSDTGQVYWISKRASVSVAVSPAPPVSTTCINSFTVTPNEKVVLATCSGLYVWKGVWQQFQNGGWIYVRAIDDNFVYAVDETNKKIHQYPVSLVNFPGISINPSKLDYATSKATCESHGGHIVSNYRTTRDYDIWQSLVRPSPSSTWWYYGAHLQQPGGTFQDYDGNQIFDDKWLGTEPNGSGDEEECIISIAPYGEFADAPCASATNPSYSRCEVSPKKWSTKSNLVFAYSVLNADGCGELESPVTFPAYDDDQSSKAVFTFNNLNVSKNSIAQKAFLKFIPSADSSHSFQYSVNLVYKPMDTLPCVNRTDTMYSELSRPVPWEITGDWRQGVPVYSSDISTLVNFMIRKKTWLKDSTFQIVLLPLNISSGVTVNNQIVANQTELVINYEDKYPNRYLMLKSVFDKSIPINTIMVGPFYPSIKIVSFWINMRGPDCGALFVWQGSVMKMQFFGEFYKGWKQLWVQLSNHNEINELVFVGINNLGPKGHILLDHFKGHSESNIGVYGDETSTYDRSDRTNYKTLLVELGIPQPVLLYTFEKTNVLNDFGLFELHLSSHGGRCYGSWSDRYQFVEHVTEFRVDSKHCPNQNLYRSDLTQLNDLINANDAFSILVNIQRYKDDYMRNATIFMFYDEDSPGNKFALKETPRGLVIRIFNQSKHLVVERELDPPEYFTYLVITYSKGYMQVYMNKKLKAVIDIDPALLNPFPNGLTFIRDPEDFQDIESPGKPTKEEGDYIKDKQFAKGLSCFQMYAQALDLQKIEQVEFCPNRQARVFHRKRCEDGGKTVVFQAGCVCQEYNKRYILPTCNSALGKDVYKNAYVYVRFDIPTASWDYNNIMQLNTNQIDDKLWFTSGPVNTALCIKGNSPFTIGSMASDCLSSFTGCAHGYVVAFWLFVEENKMAATVEVFKFHTFSMEVDFTASFSYNDTFRFKMVDCDDALLVIGTKTYHHYLLLVAAGKTSYQIYVDGILHGDYTCTPNLPDSPNQELVVGGATKVCIDDFAVTPRLGGEVYHELFYESIVKGTFSDYSIATGLRTQISIPFLFVMTPTTTDYLDAFADVSSESSLILMETVNEIMSDVFSNFTTKFYSVKARSLSYGKDNYVKITDALFNFETFTKEHEEFFQECPQIIDYFGKIIEIYCDGWTPVHGLSQVEINVISPKTNKAEVHVINRLPVHESYHLGFRVRLEFEALGDEEVYVQEELYDTGVGVFHFHVEISRWYTATLWAITHEGYGKRTVFEFLSAGDGPYHTPNATVFNTSSTSINVTVLSFDKTLWNDLQLFYRIYWKPLTNDSLLDEDITLYTFYEYDFSNFTFMANLSDLEPFTHYVIRIQAFNTFGDGPFYNFTCLTDQWVPEVAPNITATSVTKTLNISWVYTDNIYLWNAWELQQFYLTLSPVFQNLVDVDRTFAYHVDSSVFNLETHVLDYFSLYQVDIGGITVNGLGVTNRFCLATSQYFPEGAPRVATVIGTTTRSINLNIGDVEHKRENGIVMYYNITFTSMDWDDEIHSVITSNISHPEPHWILWDQMNSFNVDCSIIDSMSSVPNTSLLINHTVPELVPYTNYMFNITACTQYGCALTTNASLVTVITVAERTLPDVPECFPNITSFGNSSSTKIFVNWNHLTHYCKHGDLLQYRIGILDNDLYPDLANNKSLIDFDQVAHVFTTASDTIEFEGLRNFWNYSIFIAFENVAGRGPISDLGIVFTDEAIPTGPPTDIQVVAYNYTSLLLNISVPERSLRNGIILGYEVTLFNELNEEFVQTFPCDELVAWNNTDSSSAEHSTSVIFSGLRAYFNHSITVKAFTRVGLGPSSAAVVGRTGETIPSDVPANIAVYDVTYDSIAVQWNRIPYIETHGIMRQYMMNCTGFLADGTEHATGPFIVPYDESMHLFAFNVTNLFPDTIYNFTLIGCTTPGCSTKTNVTYRTLEREPSHYPLNITSLNNTVYENLPIQWLDIASMDKRGVITQYHIWYQKINHTWDTVDSQANYQILQLVPAEITNLTRLNVTMMDDNRTVSAPVLTPVVEHTPNGVWFGTVLTGLENYTDYMVRIAGKTDIGIGSFADHLIFRTPQNVPSKTIALNGTGFLTAFDVYVNYSPLPRQYHEGVLLGYMVFYQQVGIVQECLDLYAFDNCSTSMLHVNTTDGEYVEVGGLEPGTNYSVCIAGFTSAGTGPVSCTWAKTEDAVHGNWSAWSEWGYCDQTCGGGVQMKYRWCVDPVPDNGGDFCVGSANSSRMCNDFKCNDYYFGDPFTNCNDTCKQLGGTFLCIPSYNPFNVKIAAGGLVRDPHNSTNFYDGSCFMGEKTEEGEVSLSNYTKPSHPSFDMATELCEGYSNVPFMTDCSGMPEANERRLCYCANEEVLHFLEWGIWSPCTKTCGLGQRTRYRECIKEGLDEKYCPPKNMSEYQDCNAFQCPIDGQWGNWSEWSGCSKPCGFGEISRTRECDNPKPNYGGIDCQYGVTEDTIPGCNAHPCPVHGGWGEWQEIEKCTQPCGMGGVKRQIRYCDNPSPLHGGKPCLGIDENLFKCNEHLVCSDEMEVTYILRFINETWNYRMVYDTSDLYRDFTRRLTESLNYMYDNSTDRVRNTMLDIIIHQLSKGSVIANFTVQYSEISSAQVILMQHAIEELQIIHDMPLVKVNLTSNDIPKQLATAHVKSFTPYSINVTWSKSSSNGTFLYYVYYRLLDADPPVWTIKGFANFTDRSQLIDLLPATWYGIRVLASVPGGNGIATEEMKVRTLEGPPFSAPPNATFQVVDHQTAFLSWLHIPKDEVPGTLLGYRISYRPYYGQDTIEITVDPFTLMRTLKDLKPNSFYWTEICGFTVAGEGPKSLVVVQTPYGPPSVKPPNITTYDLYHTNQIKLTWEPIPKELQNGRISGYKITYQLVRKYAGEAVMSRRIDQVVVDQFVFGHTIDGLLANSEYKITLCAYAPEGDGPTFDILISTCKCPPVLYNNFYDNEPYSMYNRVKYDMAGLFPEILQMVIDNVCTDTCNSYNKSTLYYDRTYSGDPSRKKNENGVRRTIGQSAHLNFPVQGRMEMQSFQGDHPFVGIVSFQGTAFVVYHEAVISVGVGGIFIAVLNAWPVIMLSCIMAWLCGCVYWFTEQTSEESEIDIHNAKTGPLQGFWLAFITMTTVGYGDINPSTFQSKVLMIIWALIGLVVFGITMGAIGSGLIVVTQTPEIKIYGTKTAVIDGTFENRLAIIRNADLTHNKTYHSVKEVFQAVSSKEMPLGLIDANSLAGYESEMMSMNLVVGKIYDSGNCFGVVLSDGFEAMEDEVRSFVLGQAASIADFIESKVPRLEPYTLESSEQLLTHEEFNKLSLNSIYLILILSFFGLLNTLRLYLRKKKVVQPEKQDYEELNDQVGGMQNFVECFKDNFQNKVDTIEKRQGHERCELIKLRHNHRRDMVRSGFLAKQVDNKLEQQREKAVNRILRSQKQERLERLIRVQQQMKHKY